MGKHQGKISAKQISDKGLILRSQRELLKLNNKGKQLDFSMGKRFMQILTKEDIQIVNTHMKSHSSSSVIRETQNEIKTKMKWLRVPTRTTKAKKTDNTKCWQGCKETGTPTPCCKECKTVQLLWKTIQQFLMKLNIYFTV